jgi:SAM-dependent methyltransferase
MPEAITSYPARPRRRSIGSQVRKTFRAIRWGFALALIKTAFHVAKGGGRPYQPVEIGGRRFDNARETEQRWQAVAEVLRQYEVRTVLDIGCAEGWFVRRAAADLDCFAIGIEAADTVIVGELARLHDRINRVASIRAFMTPETIRALPKFDAVLCLSVLHHVIRGLGIASAEQFLRAVASRAEKVLIFEIGTADESSWTSVLPELTEGQKPFVTSLLERCGFHNVRVIGESLGYHREVPRLLFAAEPESKTSKVSANLCT